MQNSIFFQCTDIKAKKEKGSKTQAIYMFGRQQNGNSITVKVNEFYHYFFIRAPDLPYTSKISLPQLLDFLNGPIKDYILRDCQFDWIRKQDMFKDIEIVTGVSSLWGYATDEQIAKRCAYKITIYSPDNMYKINEFFENVNKQQQRYFLPDYIWLAFGLLSKSDWSATGRFFEIFETNVDFILRFMVDTKITGMQWVNIKNASFEAGDHITTTNEYACVEYNLNNIIPDPTNNNEVSAPIRRMYFDIECRGETVKRENGTVSYLFPRPESDPIIQIACITIIGTDANNIYDSVIFALGNHGEKSINNNSARVISFYTNNKNSQDDVYLNMIENEKKMLLAFQDYIVNTCDPDMIYGYNSDGFDWPYVINRMAALNINKEHPQWGRMVNVETIVKTKNFESKGLGRMDILKQNNQDVLLLI